MGMHTQISALSFQDIGMMAALRLQTAKILVYCNVNSSLKFAVKEEATRSDDHAREMEESLEMVEACSCFETGS